MKNKFLMSLLLGLGLFFAATGSLRANPIDFNEVGLFTTDPLISSVQFFAGDPLSLNDTIVLDDGGGDQHLLNGFDDGTGDSPGLFDTFIGAKGTGGLVFDSVTVDIAGDVYLPPSTEITLWAVSGGAVVEFTTLVVVDPDFSENSVTVAFAAGFDTVWISDDLEVDPFFGGPPVGEFFHIDNFGWTEFTDPGGNGNGTDPIPEPTTVLLVGMGLGGLGLTALRRRRKEKNLQENS